MLPLFDGLDMDRIRLIDNDADAAAALHALIDLPVVGFDTESKPTFVRGDVSTGPHLVQFATLERGWLFQLTTPGCRRAVQALLASRSLVKAGFGLDNDRSQLARSLGGPVHALLDLDAVVRSLGYPKSVGVKTAIALLFGQRFVKSKKIGTSNWAQPQLTESQQRYAANDAYAALRVYQALQAADPSHPLLGAPKAPSKEPHQEPDAPDAPEDTARAAPPRQRRREPATAPSAQGLVVHQTVPLLRIHDVDRALRFYAGLLGFAVDWEQPADAGPGAGLHADADADADAPRYVQVSRAGCVLHLSEREGDGSAGTTVFLRCTGLVAFHAELTARGYAVMRPGVEKAPWGGDLMTVTDPFGNRLRFVQDGDPSAP